MPEQQITNPAGAFTYGAPSSQAGSLPMSNIPVGVRTVPMQNGSTASIPAGSVVKLSTQVNASSAQYVQFDAQGTLQDTSNIGVLLWGQGTSQMVSGSGLCVATGKVGDVVVEGLTLVSVSSAAIPSSGVQLTGSTAVNGSSGASGTNAFGLAKTTTQVQGGTSAAGIAPGTIIGVAMSSVLDPQSTTSVALIWAYIHQV